MHELSIAEELLHLIESRAHQEGIKKVDQINLRIGELSGVFPDSLEFAFEVLSKGKITEGAYINIEMVTPKFQCINCGNYTASVVEKCPTCSSSDMNFSGGDELEIISFEGD
ncbi:MAG: hydrogenase maturation nickel metallochaperone HypA [Spirochaetota bacterium]|nr:MAG: hydrogenase maturation nickel metallochaperone HypA [Spirochaetota bacterium]